MRRNRWKVNLWLGILIISGCGVSHSTLVKELFLDNGFGFVWETTLPSSGFNVALLTISHSMERQNPPEALSAGHGYLFYPDRPTDFEKLGLHTLPDAIKKVGCRVTRAPGSAGDLVFPYVGGPTFQIRFSCGREAYELRAVVDPRLGAVRGMANTTALVLIREE